MGIYSLHENIMSYYFFPWAPTRRCTNSWPSVLTFSCFFPGSSGKKNKLKGCLLRFFSGQLYNLVSGTVGNLGLQCFPAVSLNQHSISSQGVFYPRLGVSDLSLRQQTSLWLLTDILIARSCSSRGEWGTSFRVWGTHWRITIVLTILAVLVGERGPKIKK